MPPVHRFNARALLGDCHEHFALIDAKLLHRSADRMLDRSRSAPCVRWHGPPPDRRYGPEVRAKCPSRFRVETHRWPRAHPPIHPTPRKGKPRDPPTSHCKMPNEHSNDASYPDANDRVNPGNPRSVTAGPHCPQCRRAVGRLRLPGLAPAPRPGLRRSKLGR